MRQIEGRNPILEALKVGLKMEKILLQQGSKGERVQEIMSLASIQGTNVQLISKQELDNLAVSNNHQGAIAFAEDYKYAEIDDIFQYAESKKEAPLVVLLDEIQDPHNLGSIIRTANATGVHGVIIPKHRAVEVTSVVSKTSAGAVEFIKIVQVTNLARTIENLQQRGLWFVGADLASQQVIYQTDLKGPLGVVIGSEGSGLRRLVKEKCDFLVQIPMYGQINSLNASVATGVILYEVVRQRHYSI